MTQPENEKRKHARYNVPDETAILVYPSVILSDNLIDLSMGGASFTYSEPEPFEVGQRILINIIRGEIGIEDLPAIVVDDRQIGEGIEPDRRCGIKFVSMSEEQKEKISGLIEQLK